MMHDAPFYFANLGADVSRCIAAVRQGNESRYNDCLSCAHCTLEQLRRTNRPEAYEEGLLMLRGLDLARKTPGEINHFESALTEIIGTFAARVGSSTNSA